MKLKSLPSRHDLQLRYALASCDENSGISGDNYESDMCSKVLAAHL
jgi:hypothetical protein